MAIYKSYWIYNKVLNPNASSYKSQIITDDSYEKAVACLFRKPGFDFNEKYLYGVTKDGVDLFPPCFLALVPKEEPKNEIEMKAFYKVLWLYIPSRISGGEERLFSDYTSALNQIKSYGPCPDHKFSITRNSIELFEFCKSVDIPSEEPNQFIDYDATSIMNKKPLVDFGFKTGFKLRPAGSYDSVEIETLSPIKLEFKPQYLEKDNIMAARNAYSFIAVLHARIERTANGDDATKDSVILKSGHIIATDIDNAKMIVTRSLDAKEVPDNETLSRVQILIKPVT